MIGFIVHARPLSVSVLDVNVAGAVAGTVQNSIPADLKFPPTKFQIRILCVDFFYRSANRLLYFSRKRMFCQLNDRSTTIEIAVKTHNPQPSQHFQHEHPPLSKLELLLPVWLPKIVSAYVFFV